MIPHGLAVVQAQTCRQFNDNKCAQSIIGNVRHRPSRLIAICERAPQLKIGNIGTGNTPTLATLPHRLRALLLLHRRKPSCLHESHDITSRVPVSMLLRRRGLLFPATGYLRDEFVSPFNGLRQRTIRAAFCVGRPIERFPLLPHHNPRRPCLKSSEREKPLADSPCRG